jgi:ankyrin repeat protein
MRCQAIGKQMSTAMHMAVELNDYDALKLILDYNGEPRRELGLKDGKGKNSLDIAFELDFASMKDLLQRNGGHQSSLAIQEQQKILQIMKPISTRKNEQEPITLFNTIIANSTDRFQKLLMQGEDINQRDA